MSREGDRAVTDPGTQIRPPLVTRTFLLITAATFAYFIAVGTMLPVLPRYVEGPLGKGSVAVGLSVGSFSLVALLLRPLAGRLGDRRGRRLLIVLGSAVVACSVAALTVATSLSVLILLRLCTGAGEAFFFTGVASAIHDLAPDDRRGEAVSYFSLALYAGLAVGPILGEGILGDRNFSAVWWVAAALCGLAAVLALRLPDTRSAAPRSPGRSRLVHPAAVVPGVVVTTSVWGFSG
ncbi:MAG TPA: MFS transporter, partial [Actinomycetota bacterium]